MRIIQDPLNLTDLVDDNQTLDTYCGRKYTVTYPTCPDPNTRDYTISCEQDYSS